jgi:hypothetical protein
MITLKWLEKQDACGESVAEWKRRGMKSISCVDLAKLLLKDDSLKDGLDWCNWLVTKNMTYSQIVRYVVYAAEQVIDIWEKKYPGEDTPREAIRAAKRCLKNSTKKNKDAAADAAADAATLAAADDVDAAALAAAYAAYAAAYVAAYAAYAAAYVAIDAVVHAVIHAAHANAAGAIMKKKILRYGIKLLGRSEG